MFFCAAVLFCVGLYGMLAMWHEFGGSWETNEMGVVVSGIGWGGAALIVLIELWKMYGQEIKRYAKDRISTAKEQTVKIKSNSKSKKAYEELLRCKTLHESGILNEEEFAKKMQELKKDLL